MGIVLMAVDALTTREGQLGTLATVGFFIAATGVAGIAISLESLGVTSRIERGVNAVLYAGLGLLIFGALGFFSFMLVGFPAFFLDLLVGYNDQLPPIIFQLPIFAVWLGLSAIVGCFGLDRRDLHWAIKAVRVILGIPLLVGLYWIGKGGIAMGKRIMGR